MRLVTNTENDSSSEHSVSFDSTRSGSLVSSVDDADPLLQSMRNGNSHVLSNGSGASTASIRPCLPLRNGIKSTSHDSSGGSEHIVSRVNLSGTRLFDDSSIDREEFVRLVVQCLRDVGYTESAATLEAESGYRMESPEITHFRTCVLTGDWNDAEVCLPSLDLISDDSLRIALFLIRQQKYLELLEAQNINSALHVLRNELAPLSIDVDELHSLSSLIMCSNGEDLKLRARWDGAKGSSRKVLLSELQRFVTPSTMMPQRRLVTLIDQAFLHQRTNCLYHNAPYTPENFSLYTDHHCSRTSFPLLTTNILKEHTDEVWDIKWSHDGRYLASVSKDKTALIWHIGDEIEPNVRECSLEKSLKDHKWTVGCLAWSPDGCILLTSTEQIIKIWNVKTGVCIRDMTSHDETVSALEWLPDGSGFLSGGLDRRVILWDAEGIHEDVWLKSGVRVMDLAIAPNLSRLVVVGLENLPVQNMKLFQDGQNGGGSNTLHATLTTAKENRLIIYDFASRTQEASIRLEGELTSVKISQDSRYALINHAPDELLLWDLETARLARKFTGQRQGQHVIRSCFGGIDGNFIVSGSEDGKVYIWHRDTGVLLEILDGHGVGSVNAVAWNPRIERMFATCSDDRSIRIWESPHVSLLEGNNAQMAVQPLQAVEKDEKGKGREVPIRRPSSSPSLLTSE